MLALRAAAMASALLLLVGLDACVVVPRYARGIVSDPAMQPADGLYARTIRKLRGAREGAAGGDGVAAGGGCGCGQ
ncbi:MAG: DUF4266 domain-containing protein [Sandaracinaceae bacterium]|nr:DUF4266 domain-containing protein [Sandaracinaceae bacterium]